MTYSPYNENAPFFPSLKLGGGGGGLFIHFVQDCSWQWRLVKGILLKRDVSFTSEKTPQFSLSCRLVLRMKYIQSYEHVEESVGMHRMFARKYLVPHDALDSFIKHVTYQGVGITFSHVMMQSCVVLSKVTKGLYPQMATTLHTTIIDSVYK